MRYREATRQYDSDEYIEIKSDGSFFVRDGRMGMSGKWKQDEDISTITLEMGMADRLTSVADTLIVESDGYKYVRREN